MPKVSPIQSSFNGGEFSSLLGGRVDLSRYKEGLAKCVNFVPCIQGGLTRRPGTRFISEIKDSSKQARLMKFEFSITQAYMLEMGNQYIRFYMDEELITLTPQSVTAITKANPAVLTYSGSDTYSNGDRVILYGISGMSELNNREFIVANVNTAANTFELHDTSGNAVDSSTYTTYTSGGSVAEVYEISSPYLEADLFQIKATQSADVLYLVHPIYAPRKLSRTAHTSWTLSVIDFIDGPYLNINTTSTTLTPSATTGAGITITASAALFASTDVGRLIRLKHVSTWGYVKITAFTDSTHVTADIKSTLGGTTAVTTFRLGLYSDTTGYPGAVVFHEDRLFLGGPGASPQRLDGSNSSDYENMAPTATDGTVTDSNAVGYSLNSNDVNYMRWIASDEKGLMGGTHAGEWIVRPSVQGEALSPTNVSAKPTTFYGSEDIQPVRVGKSTLFVQRHGRKLREINYVIYTDGFEAEDLTVLSEHVSAGGFTQLAYQKELQSIVWAVRGDGVLTGMTYERDVDDIKAAWHRHILGGESDAAGNPTKVESIAVIPASDGQYDELWVVVQRYINGSVKRYVEILTKLFEDTDDQKDAFFVDAGLTYDLPLTISGATKASPVVVTSTAHGLSNGDIILISGVAGMNNLNTNTYKVANVAANTFELTNETTGANIDGTSFGTYVSGGQARKYISHVTGLFHLEGQTVQILGDGAVQPQKTVTKGAITLSTRATTIQIGLGYESDGQILRIEAGAADGTALGKTRRIHRVGFLLHRSLGLKIGVDFDSLQTLTFRKTSDVLSRSVPLFSGILSEILEADYDFDNQFCWRQDQPLPLTILAVMPQMVTEDRG
jgi:hypothetical protein